MGGGGGGDMGYGGGMQTDASFDDYAIAVRLIKHEKYAEAIPHLDAALANRPHSADILNYLGYTHRMTGDYNSSLDYYKRRWPSIPTTRACTNIWASSICRCTTRHPRSTNSTRSRASVRQAAMSATR